jgi:hypothetical protein
VKYGINEVVVALTKKLKEAAREVGGDGGARMSTPSLSKADGGPSWQSDDGLSIPKTGTPDRKRWDRAFMSRVREVFGAGIQPRKIRVPIEDLIQRNPPVNGARLDLYRRMARKDKLPPIVVEKRPHGWFVTDGNHRMNAAKLEGHTHMDAVELR